MHQNLVDAVKKHASIVSSTTTSSLLENSVTSSVNGSCKNPVEGVVNYPTTTSISSSSDTDVSESVSMIQKLERDRGSKESNKEASIYQEGSDGIENPTISLSTTIVTNDIIPTSSTNITNQNIIVFISNCTVLPLSLPIDKWIPSFKISDHRPVSATIILAKSKASSNLNTNNNIKKEQ